MVVVAAAGAGGPSKERRHIINMIRIRTNVCDDGVSLGDDT